jgi:energy-coupling factor transporter ATP-binding protein EcfA2
VDVPEIKTVIQLGDLKDDELRRMIIETFVITAEVLDNLRSIFVSLAGQEGRGVFLKGHFGSGKSHFLSMLSQVLNGPRARDVVLSQAPSLKQYSFSSLWIFLYGLLSYI